MFTHTLINTLLDGLDLTSSDLVLLQLWAEDDYKQVLCDFSYALARRGIACVLQQHSRIYYLELFKNHKGSSSLFTSTYFDHYKPITVVIDLLAYEPVQPHQDFPKDQLPLYGDYMRNLFKTLQIKKKFVQLRLPTLENSQHTPLSFETYKETLLHAYNINYTVLKNTCQTYINKFSGKQCLEIKTSSSHLLSFSLEQRNWHRDDGTGDLPAGEIYIAPTETSACGSLYIDKLYYFDTQFGHITLHFDKGILTHSSDEVFNTHLRDLPPGGNVLGEFGIGLNPNIHTLTGYTPLDEKILGTCHIALGMNHLFGGTNTCPFHDDMVFKADVYLDGTLILDNGMPLLK